MSKASRRKFLTTVPVAVAGAVATKAFAQGQGQQAQGPIKAETVDCAEVIPGLHLSKEDEAAVANGLNRNLQTYARLRDLPITPDIDPALIFKPSLPGQEGIRPPLPQPFGLLPHS